MLSELSRIHDANFKKKPGKYYSLISNVTQYKNFHVKQTEKRDYLERIAKINEENDFGS